jgi:hypothetical protein
MRISVGRTISSSVTSRRNCGEGLRAAANLGEDALPGLRFLDEAVDALFDEDALEESSALLLSSPV